jgi:hypothetical protein
MQAARDFGPPAGEILTQDRVIRKKGTGSVKNRIDQLGLTNATLDTPRLFLRRFLRQLRAAAFRKGESFTIAQQSAAAT